MKRLGFKSKRGESVASKDVLHKRMQYLPLVPRLERLYVSMSTTPYMRCHYENRRNDGVMTHDSHGEACQQFDQIYPDFAYNQIE